MTTRFTIILAGSLFYVTQAFAHRPYERVAASFTRSDGVTVSAVEHYVDGIFGADPVSVQFRLPDGTVISRTERTLDTVVVRRTLAGVVVYRFPNDWIPVATSAQQFDGFSLTDITTSRERLFSPLVHTRAHWGAYAVVLVLAAVFVACWLVARAIPKRGKLAVLRLLGFVAVGLAAALCVLLVLVAVPVSPFILCIFGGISVVLCLPMKRFLRHTQAG